MLLYQDHNCRRITALTYLPAAEGQHTGGAAVACGCRRLQIDCIVVLLFLVTMDLFEKLWYISWIENNGVVFCKAPGYTPFFLFYENGSKMLCECTHSGMRIIFHVKRLNQDYLKNQF